MRLTGLAINLLLFCLSNDLLAQQRHHLPMGVRVRGKAPVCWPGVKEGVAREVSEDKLAVVVSNELVRCALYDMLWLERLRPGESGNTLGGVFVGGLVFGGFGYLLSTMDDSDNPAGVVVGGLVGWKIKSRNWEPLPLNELGVAVAPRRDGVGLVLSLTF